jgi:hypothetical protein
MPPKAALIIMLIPGTFALVGGIAGKDIRGILIGSAILGFVIVSLILGRKKRAVNKNR